MEAQKALKYAPFNPTPEEVRTAELTDLVQIKDEALAAGIAELSNVSGDEINVENMYRVTDLTLI